MAVVEKIYFPVVGQNLSVKVPRGCLKSVKHKLVDQKLLDQKLFAQKLFDQRPIISLPNVCFPYVENSLSNSFWSPLKLTYPSVEIDGGGKLPEIKKIKCALAHLTLFFFFHQPKKAG